MLIVLERGRSLPEAATGFILQEKVEEKAEEKAPTFWKVLGGQIHYCLRNLK